MRTKIGRFRRAFGVKTGKRISVGKSEFFHYKDLRTPGSQKRILGLRQFDTNGSVKTLSYPVDNDGEMVTGVWGSDPGKGLYNEELVRIARNYVKETATAPS